MRKPRSAVIVSLAVAGLLSIALSHVSRSSFWRKYMMDETTLAFKTICVGRYEFEIPRTFNATFESVELNGFAVTRFSVISEAEMNSLAADRQSSLKTGIRDEALGETSVLRWARYENGATLLAADQSYDLPGVEVEGYTIEAYVFRGGSGFRLDGFVSFDRENQRLEQLRAVLTGLQSGEGQGFCLDGAHYRNELSTGTATIILQDPSVDRYSLTVSASAGLHAPASMSGESSTSPVARPREIAGEPGFETRMVADKASLNEYDVMIRFSARAGDAAREGHPYSAVSLRLAKDAADADAPPYDIATSVQIWEKALSSMKRRP